MENTERKQLSTNGKLVLTSCGIRNEEFKNRFYEIISKEDLKSKKVLYITTAVDGERDDNKGWVAAEYETILNLGIDESNITEYKIGNDINVEDFDIIYMIGGNTFYLLDVIRKTGFAEKIISFINSGKVYIGSSAGSEILGNSVEISLGYDENNINMTDFTGLKIVDGLLVPHSNKKEEFIKTLKSKTNENIILLYDGDGIII